jgi:hypothetical protein
VIRRSALVWNPSQHITKGFNTAKWAILKTSNLYINLWKIQEMDVRVDDARPDASIYAENEPQYTEDSNQTNQGLALSQK